uniref:Uncharacterized protein n=1 Tax=Aegilops tauschii subsp. strangulata TaxID=200361 RepID=A0A453KUT2_AEGTS
AACTYVSFARPTVLWSAPSQRPLAARARGRFIRGRRCRAVWFCSLRPSSALRCHLRFIFLMMRRKRVAIF